MIKNLGNYYLYVIWGSMVKKLDTNKSIENKKQTISYNISKEETYTGKKTNINNAVIEQYFHVKKVVKPNMKK